MGSVVGGMGAAGKAGAIGTMALQWTLNDDSPAAMDAAISVVWGHGLVTDLVELCYRKGCGVQLETTKIV